MAIPSRVLGAGTSGGTTTAICGDVNNAVAAAGATAIGTATQLSAVMNVVTTGTASTATSVKLPLAEPGAMVYVANRSGITISIFPQNANQNINNGSAGAAVTLANNARTQFFGTSTTEWYQGA
jgi:hypothetical protein